MRLFLAAAVVAAASGAVIQNHHQRAAARAAAKPVLAAPEPVHVVDVVRVDSLPDAMSIERVTASNDEPRDQGRGGFVLPDRSRKAPAIARLRPPLRKGPQVSAATHEDYPPRRRHTVGVVGQLRNGLRVALDKQSWRRTASRNPFRDDSQYRSRRTTR